MDYNFRDLDGAELFGKPHLENAGSDNSIYWVLGIFVFIIGAGIFWLIGFGAGRENVMPAITQTTPENQKSVQSDSDDENAQVASDVNILPENNKTETITNPQKDVTYHGVNRTWHS